MNSFLFAINAVAPIVIMTAIGYILKKAGLFSAEFSKTANKSVFKIFLPAMLFLNVYKIDISEKTDLSYILYVFAVVLVLFALSIPLARIASEKNERRSVIMQAAFRSNYALIGIPLAQSLFGEEGVIVATLLSALVIPLFNILAVIALSIYGKGKPNVKKILLDILKNPLIQSIALGGIFLMVRSAFVNYGVSLRLTDITPVYKVLTYLSNVATPLSLLVLGAQFEFSRIGDMKREIFSGIIMRTFIIPVLGLGTAYLLFADNFNGAHFAAFIAVFTTPMAVSSVAMSQEMGADAELAGQLVIWTTVSSAFTTFIASFILKSLGVF